MCFPVTSEGFGLVNGSLVKKVEPEDCCSGGAVVAGGGEHVSGKREERHVHRVWYEAGGQDAPPGTKWASQALNGAILV